MPDMTQQDSENAPVTEEMVTIPKADLLEVRQALVDVKAAYDNEREEREEFQRKFEVVGIYLVTLAKRLTNGGPIYVHDYQFQESINTNLRVDFENGEGENDGEVRAKILTEPGENTDEMLEAIYARFRQDPLTPMYRPDSPQWVNTTMEEVQATVDIIEGKNEK